MTSWADRRLARRRARAWAAFQSVLCEVPFNHPNGRVDEAVERFCDLYPRYRRFVGELGPHLEHGAGSGEPAR